MKDKKYADDDPERTLITLDQLSQTIEVMTSVVNRLRRHLSDQIKAQLEAQEELSAAQVSAAATETAEAELQQSQANKRDSFVVEISQQEIDPIRKSNKTLH
ncbi:MAG: hypothetical protein WDZ52_15695 [Pseudohongiellaceae bacterium]